MCVYRIVSICGCGLVFHALVEVETHFLYEPCSLYRYHMDVFVCFIVEKIKICMLQGFNNINKISFSFSFSFFQFYFHDTVAAAVAASGFMDKETRSTHPYGRCFHLHIRSKISGECERVVVCWLNFRLYSIFAY